MACENFIVVVVRLSIPAINDLQELDCYGCPWISENSEYKENIRKLIILQKWFKGCLLSNRLKGMIKPLTEIYYHPLSRGGYNHKRSMMNFVNDLN